MSSSLLEIQPRELKFIFELKKQSSCSVRLTNLTHQYVGFKVKTTSPKKYCVRPNVGVILPKGVCEFTVTMQAQRVAPPDLICKDKFLIQSTVVPDRSTDEDITGSIFSKDGGAYIEENKLRVALVSPPHSPVLSPINGTFNQLPIHEAAVLKEPEFSRAGVHIQPQVSEDEEPKMLNFDNMKPKENAKPKQSKDVVNGNGMAPKRDEVKERNDVVNGFNFKQRNDEAFKVSKDVVGDGDGGLIKDAELKQKRDVYNDGDMKQAKPNNEDRNDRGLEPVEDVELKSRNNVFDAVESKTEKDAEPETSTEGKLKLMETAKEPNLVKEIEEMKSTLNDLEKKLGEAELTISKLTAERKLTIQEKKTLQEELVLLRGKTGTRKVQVGFPLLFVCMVALVSTVVGYLLHP